MTVTRIKTPTTVAEAVTKADSHAFPHKSRNKNSLTWCRLQRSCERDDSLSGPPPHTICWH